MSIATARQNEHTDLDRGPDEGDRLDAEDRARLHASLWKGHEDMKAGRYVDPPFLEESEDDGPDEDNDAL